MVNRYFPDSGCPGREQSLGKIVTDKQTSRNGTRFKHVGRSRFRQPRQPPVRGVGMTCPEQNPVKQRRSPMAEATLDTNARNSTIPARCNMPLNNVSKDGAWHKVMTKNRYVKPMETQDSRTVVSELDDFEINRAKMTVVGTDVLTRLLQSDRMVDQLEQ